MDDALDGLRSVSSSMLAGRIVGATGAEQKRLEAEQKRLEAEALACREKLHQQKSLRDRVSALSSGEADIQHPEPEPESERKAPPLARKQAAREQAAEAEDLTEEQRHERFRDVFDTLDDDESGLLEPHELSWPLMKAIERSIKDEVSSHEGSEKEVQIRLKAAIDTASESSTPPQTTGHPCVFPCTIQLVTERFL